MEHSRVPWMLFTIWTLLSTKTTTGMTVCPTIAQSLSVATTEEARDLATALNCSGGGVFSVTWEGTLIVEETITVMEGTVLTINGMGSDAIADGSWATQLFKVSEAVLHLTDLDLINGFGVYGGGALYIVNASVTLSGDTKLGNNVGKPNGGALWIGGESSHVSWIGTTTFTNNSASRYGGAVAIEENATVEWSGDTSFDRNRADIVSGGAVFVSTANVSWTGTTNFTGNYADVGGGALYSEENSVVMWSGQTLFSNNSARLYAGATYFMEGSFVSWKGETIFRQNYITAIFEGGGAFQAEESRVKWQGNVSFIENQGSKGGAINLGYGAIVSWEGETIFRDNEANEDGGALYLDVASTASWERAVTTFQNNSNVFAGGGAISLSRESSISFGGVTHFRNNTATTSGGALDTGEECKVYFIADSLTIFEDNESGTTGGAVALGSDTLLEIQTNATLNFTGNSAVIGGGAVYQFGITSGFRFLGVTFTSNSATTGGAVYSLASKTDEFTVTEFIGCRFDGNTAENVGGALRLAGTSNVSNCQFVRNGAHEAGPAVTNEGSITIEKTTFSKNTLLCSPGTFLSYSTEENAGDEDVQEDLYYESICDGCLPCTDCTVGGKGTQECIVMLEHTESAGVDTGTPITLETLRIEKGYWRAVASSESIFPCWNSDACLGGITGENGYCKEGYSGAYCAVCEEDYAAALSYTCSKCSGTDGLVVATLVLVVVSVILAAAIVHLLSAPETPELIGPRRTTIRTTLLKVMRAIPPQAVKTIVVSWQILTQFDSVADVTYPGAYGRLLDGLGNIVNLDLGLVLSVGCAMKTDFHDRLLISTLGPLGALGALGVCFRVAARKYREAPEVLERIRRKHLSLALLVTFLVYLSVSSTIFRMFACEELDDGGDYLRADYSIMCNSSKHRALQGYASFMIFLYPVGIPVLYGIVLFGNREALKENHRRSGLSADLELMADLWNSYKPERYYYEIVECARRVTLTGVVVFIFPFTAAQVAITLLLSFAFLVVSESLDPYASFWDTLMSRVGHMVVFLSMFQALLIKVDVTKERSESQEIFGEVLLTVHVGMVAAVIAEAVMTLRSFCGRPSPEETAEPRSRGNGNLTRVMESFDIKKREASSLI